MSKNKVEKKKFMGTEVRIVNNTHIVMKDMFSSLGRVRDDGTWTDEKKKLISFLDDINKNDHHEKIGVVVKKGQTEEVDCVRIETVPIILTQFKPSAKRDKDTKEILNQNVIDKWKSFMIFVDGLLTSLEVYKYIIVDKESQKDKMERLTDAEGNCMIANQQTNTIMAKLIGVYDQGIKKLAKDELKIYQAQTTIDLLSVREFVLEKFVNAYEFTGSHKEAGAMAEKLARKKYNL